MHNAHSRVYTTPLYINIYLYIYVYTPSSIHRTRIKWPFRFSGTHNGFFLPWLTRPLPPPRQQVVRGVLLVLILLLLLLCMFCTLFRESITGMRRGMRAAVYAKLERRAGETNSRADDDSRSDRFSIYFILYFFGVYKQR